MSLVKKILIFLFSAALVIGGAVFCVTALQNHRAYNQSLERLVQELQNLGIEAGYEELSSWFFAESGVFKLGSLNSLLSVPGQDLQFKLDASFLPLMDVKTTAYSANTKSFFEAAQVKDFSLKLSPFGYQVNLETDGQVAFTGQSGVRCELNANHLSFQADSLFKLGQGTLLFKTDKMVCRGEDGARLEVDGIDFSGRSVQNEAQEVIPGDAELKMGKVRVYSGADLYPGSVNSFVYQRHLEDSTENDHGTLSFQLQGYPAQLNFDIQGDSLSYPSRFRTITVDAEMHGKLLTEVDEVRKLLEIALLQGFIKTQGADRVNTQVRLDAKERSADRIVISITINGRHYADYPVDLKQLGGY